MATSDAMLIRDMMAPNDDAHDEAQRAREPALKNETRYDARHDTRARFICRYDLPRAMMSRWRSYPRMRDDDMRMSIDNDDAYSDEDTMRHDLFTFAYGAPCLMTMFYARHMRVRAMPRAAR